LVGIRVVKTAAATVAAIYTAHYLGLEPPTAAGLLAILGVEATRLKGLRSVGARFAASVVGLLVASGVFLLFGFRIWALALFILIAFPVMSRLQLKEGAVTGAVVVFHVFVSGEVTPELIGNEILLLLTGLGWATAINLLYMPREERGLAARKRETERLFTEIFMELALTLREPSRVWSGSQLLAAEAAIDDGLRLAERNRENRIWAHEAYWRTYFEMRSRQLESIQLMAKDVAFVYESLPQGELVADVFERLSGDVASDVYEGGAERQLAELETAFRSMPLPGTRAEFEVRATLLQLCRVLDRYLAIARKLKKRRPEDRPKI